jgi:hypothetical protein
MLATTMTTYLLHLTLVEVSMHTEAKFINVQFTISLSFLGRILRVHRLEVSVYNVYITNQFQTTFAQKEGEVKSVSRVTLDSKEENSQDFCPNHV